jgi:hypothetical protein
MQESSADAMMALVTYEQPYRVGVPWWQGVIWGKTGGGCFFWPRQNRRSEFGNSRGGGDSTRATDTTELTQPSHPTQPTTD